jgi:glycosyltransferase involved in cell wall biosynthesis
MLANSVEASKFLCTQGPQWTELPLTTFDKPVALMARTWGLLNGPSYETMGGRADWLYLPADGYVPVDKAKLAVTVHDVYKLEPPAPRENIYVHYRERLKHWVIYKRIAANAERILTVSKFSASRIMNYLQVPASRIDVIYNGVSNAFFNPNTQIWPHLRARLNLEEEAPFFVYLGGLKAKKNGDGIIATWREFESRWNHGNLVILGHHDPKMLGAAKRDLMRASFPERLPDEEMAVLLANSSGMFFPSFYEGFGIPVVEAFAAGTLTVLSDIPALREIAGDLAIYVDPHDVKSMLKGLESCLELSGERQERITAGKEIAARYTWRNVIGRVRRCFFAGN